MKQDFVEQIGPFIVQKVSTLPSWQASDEGRMLYTLDTKKYYAGTDSAWQELGVGGSSGDIPQYNLGTFDQFHVVGIGVYISLREDYPGGEPGVGIAYVCARDVIQSIHGGVGTITYEISRDGVSWTSNTDPTLAYINFGCAHLGAQMIYVRLTDSDTPPSTTRIEVFAVVQDPTGICPG